jgi:hypothetical protein
MYHVSLRILIQAADLYCASVGAAAVAPAERIVVVPLVTAEMVQIPAPIFSRLITVPIGCATLALVGILMALAEALD